MANKVDGGVGRVLVLVVVIVVDVAVADDDDEDEDGRQRRVKKFVDSVRIDVRCSICGDIDDAFDGVVLDARKAASFCNRRTGECADVSSSFIVHEPKVEIQSAIYSPLLFILPSSSDCLLVSIVNYIGMSSRTK